MALVVAAGVPVAAAQAELAVGITQQGFLIQFDTATPQNLIRGVAVTGLASNESLVGIDYRQTNNTVYGVGSTGQLYTLNINTGVATATSSSIGSVLNGSNFGFDWNPQADLFRVVSDANQNLRMNINGSLAGTDTPVAYVPGGPEAGAEPNINGLAYTRLTAGATQLYGIDSGTDTLVQVNVSTGAVTTVGPLGIAVNARNGFDFSLFTGIGYLAAELEGESVTRLYQVNPGSGATTFVGIVAGGVELRGLTVVPTPGSAALLALGGLAAVRRRK